MRRKLTILQKRSSLNTESSCEAHRFCFFLLLVVFSTWSLLAGCYPTDLEHHEEHKRPTTTVAPEVISEILVDAQEDIEIIGAVRTDLSTLNAAMTGKALAELRAEVAEELKAGRIKARQFDELELKFEQIVEGTAGLTLVFKDRSYFVDKSGNRVSEPENVMKRFILSLEKSEDQWKITDLYVPAKELPFERLEEEASE